MENRQKKKSWLDRLSSGILTLLRKSFIGAFFTSYDKVNGKFKGGCKKNRHVFHRKFAKAVENNRLIAFVPKVFMYLMRVSLRDYGVMMFLTGAIVALLYPINDMILFINITFEMFVYGIAVCICSLPLLFSRRSLAANILSSKIFCAILFDFFGLDDENFRIAAKQERINFTHFALIIGLALGILSYFVMPVYTVLIVLAVAFAYATLLTPEIGAIITLLTTPFVRIEIVLVCILYTFACYIIKVRLGKRIFTFEYFDLWIVIAVITMTVCGINYKDPLSSLDDVLVNFVLMMAYFLYSNLIRSKVWFRRCIVAFTTSSLIVAIVSITQYILAKFGISVDILEMALQDGGFGITSTSAGNDALAMLLVVAIPLAMIHMISDRKDSSRVAAFFVSVILLAALIMTGSAAGLMGFIVGALFVLMFYRKNAILLFILIIAAIPTLYFTLPDNIVEGAVTMVYADGFSFKSEISYIKQAFLTVIENPLGTGLGKEAVSSAFPEIISGYIDCLPIQLLATYGVAGTVLLTIFILMFIRLILSYAVKAKNEYRRLNGCAGLCAILALLSSGAFCYVWQDKRIFLAFVAIMALSLAYIKIEREDEAVIVKYVDVTTATLDIPLKEEYVRDNTPKRRYVHTPRMKRQLKRQEKAKKAEAKEFSNTEDLIIVKTRITETKEETEE